MEEKRFCQSCGMPMEKPEDFGTNADGTHNEDYCTYCYQKGAFAFDCTMEEMIDFNLKHGGEEGFFADKEAARRMMTEWFPTLKRWKK